MINLREEKKIWRKGYKCVAGLDEAGRGCLAGPVVAAAVMVKKLKIKNQRPKIQIKNLKIFKKIKDSKKLSSRQREEFYKILTGHPDVEWGIGRVSEKKIDKINILEATKLAMEKAIDNLNSKLRKRKNKINYLILDGNFKLNLSTSQKSIVKADEKVFSCAAASIIAKVARDRIMQKYAKKFSQYGFEKNKGYPTRFHLKMLKKHAFSAIHRKTFRPVKRYNKRI